MPGGSQIPKLQALAIQIMDLCLKHHITFMAYWTPLALNELADLLSRETSLHYHEYYLTAAGILRAGLPYRACGASHYRLICHQQQRSASPPPKHWALLLCLPRGQG